VPEDPAGGFRELVFIHHFLTGKAGENDMLEAMQAGADDYLVRPFDQLE
jgi:DNA-binding response OmpR family regulator